MTDEIKKVIEKLVNKAYYDNETGEIYLNDAEQILKDFAEGVRGKTTIKKIWNGSDNFRDHCNDCGEELPSSVGLRNGERYCGYCGRKIIK